MEIGVSYNQKLLYYRIKNFLKTKQKNDLSISLSSLKENINKCKFYSKN